MELQGRRAVVTGGSRGIGRAVALALARAGASVVVTARSADAIQEVAGELQALGAHAEAIPCDVTDPDQVQALAQGASKALGSVDILVNNAGASGSAPIQRLSLDEWDRMLRVNATGPFLCTRAFLPAMIERGWGRIVTVASVAGLRGGRYIAAYAASKHAVLGLVRSAALEVAPTGITVNAVCPGFVDTPMTRESVARIVEKTGRTEREALEAILESSAQRRLVTPEEVAGAVLFLCGEEARGINGEALVIDGGGPTA
jgi:3-hydroxybutyrate dehydrogenase